MLKFTAALLALLFTAGLASAQTAAPAKPATPAKPVAANSGPKDDKYTQGVTEHLTQPRSTINKVLEQLKGQLVTDPEASPFYAPFKTIPDSVPVADKARIYVALASAHLTARDAKDGREIWRQNRAVTAPMAVEQEMLFVASADSIEALNG